MYFTVNDLKAFLDCVELVNDQFIDVKLEQSQFGNGDYFEVMLFEDNNVLEICKIAYDSDYLSAIEKIINMIKIVNGE